MATRESESRRISASGLEDVVAATTRLSDVDGERGRLVIAGKRVEDLAGSATFEDVVFLLFHGRLPGAADAARVRGALGEARDKAHARLGDLGDALRMADPMDALRAAVAHLSSGAPADDAFDETLRILG
jgi:citrate synthase